MHLHKKYIKSKNDKCLSIIQDIYLPQEIQTMIDAIIEWNDLRCYSMKKSY